MAIPLRSRASLGSVGPASALKVVPALVLLGWVLLAGGEVLTPRGAPAVPLVMAAVGGLMAGVEGGLWTGLLLGLGADLLSSLPLGSQALAAGIAGVTFGRFTAALKATTWTAPAVLLALASVPYRVVLALLVELGGHPTVPASFTERLGSIPMDAGLGVLVMLLLNRWLVGRR